MLKRFLATAAVATFFLSINAKAQTPSASHCDRACMMGTVDQYLAALVNHDPSGLPFAKGVRFTENTAEIQIGDGLWVGASEAPTTFKIYAVDPATRQAAFYAVMKENENSPRTVTSMGTPFHFYGQRVTRRLGFATGYKPVCGNF
jgi:hypothetical protein